MASRSAPVALILALSPLAIAGITSSGSVTPDPTSGTVSGQLQVGNSAVGQVTVNGGSTLNAQAVNLGNGGTGNGTVTIVGTGVSGSPQTIFNLSGPPNTTSGPNPLQVGAWGSGTMTLSNGAIVNGAITLGVPSANCSTNCNNFIGAGAGSTAIFTLTDAGTTGNFAGGFTVGAANVFTTAPGGGGFNFGTSGGTTNATLQVLNGATLNTYQSTVSQGPGGAIPSGTEHSIANVTIDGAGSTWSITRNAISGSQAFLSLATKSNASATINVTNGGQLIVNGSAPAPGQDTGNPGINMTGTSTVVGGSSTLSVSGAGSAVVINGNSGAIQVGRNGGTAELDITNGGQVYGGGTNGLLNMFVGRLGSHAALNVDGAGSQLTLSGVGGIGTGSDNAGAFLTLGRETGSVATATVTGGASILISDGGQAATAGSTGITIARDTGSFGSLTVSGPTSTVIVEQTGAGTALPSITVGRAGSGQMAITDNASVVVNGPSERDFIVGGAAGGNGTLTVSNGAQITASWFTTGNSGGTGISTIDNATVLLNGIALNPDQTIFGASARVGRGTGSTGTLNLINGGQLIIDTATANSNINLGGTSALLGGNGTINMSGGSSISFVGTGATPAVNIGHSGIGLFTMTGNSTLSLPDDGSIVLGNRAAGDGTLQLGGGSSIDTGLLYVGNNGQGHVTMTGGTLGVHGTDPNTDAFFVVGANSGAVGTFAQSGGGVSANSALILGWQTGSSGTYTLSGGTLDTQQLTVGDRGTGVFVNSAAGAASTINNVNGLLIIGGDASANGSYTITGNNAQTNVNFAPGGLGPTDPPGLNGVDPITMTNRMTPNGALGVGIGGTGTFTQGAANFSDPGNTVVVAGDLAVGVFAGGLGTYTLNTGTLTVGGKMVIGGQSQGANVFTQNGGSVTVTGAAFGNPDYVGLGGNDFAGSLTVGGGINDLGGGTGTYVLHGGTVTASLVQVGLSGTGTFNQTGGTVNTPTLWLGNCGGCNGGNASGTYNLTGTGVINAGSESIGLFGHGEFTQNGASTQNNVSGVLLIGDTPKVSPDLATPNRSGVYMLVAGQLNTQSTVVGSQGVGTFNQSGGTHTVTGDLIIGRDNAAQAGSGTPGNPFVGGPSQGTYVMTGGVLTVGGNMTVGAAGTGTMQVSGGAGITLTGPGASLVIGDTGTGLLTMIEGSTLVLPGDGKVIVGAHAGASGTVELQGASSIQAGALFGIGHDGTAPTGAAGANVYLDQGSSVTATKIYLGDGCLGGNGGVIHGNFIMDGQAVVNCAPPVLPIVHPGMIDPTGILHPGRSPGVLTFDGSFEFVAGTIVLEVESDGHGGFLTDEIIFTLGTVVDLTKANIQFAFLGNTDPNAFLPFWDLDTFLKTVSSGGAVEGISALGDLDSQFADASFTAQSSAFVITDFTFDPVEGVTSIETTPVATAVPEPGSMMLVLLGCLLLAFARRRVAASAGRRH